MLCTLKKRDTIIATIATRDIKTSNNHDTEAPESVEHSHDIDGKYGNELWRNTIENQMHVVGVAFDITDEKDKVSYGCPK